MGKLTIYLDKCTNICDKDGIGKSDPYVRFELEQDNMVGDVDYGFQRSTTKKNELNPTFGETFSFSIPTLNNMVLTCKVLDDDVGRDGKLGWCKIKLEKLGLTSEPMEVKGKVDENLIRKDGFIHLMLSFEE